MNWKYSAEKAIQSALWLGLSIILGAFLWRLVEEYSRWSTFSHGMRQTALMHSVCIGIVVLVLCEKFFPLRHLSTDDWIYKYRKLRVLPYVGRYTYIQIICSALVGWCLGIISCGAYSGAIGIGIMVILRVLIALRTPRTLSAMLDAGSSFALSGNAHRVFNSELSSQMYALAWMGKTSRPRRVAQNQNITNGFLLINRILRRSYMLLFPMLSLLISSIGFQLAGAVGLMFGSGMLMVCASSFYRAANFHSDTAAVKNSLFPRYVLLIFAALSSTALCAVCGCTGPGIAYVLWGIGIYLGGHCRGNPRKISSFTLVDPGVGMLIPRELVEYYLRGVACWGIPALVALLLFA